MQSFTKYFESYVKTFIGKRKKFKATKNLVWDCLNFHNISLHSCEYFHVTSRQGPFCVKLSNTLFHWIACVVIYLVIFALNKSPFLRIISFPLLTSYIFNFYIWIECDPIFVGLNLTSKQQTEARQYELLKVRGPKIQKIIISQSVWTW